VENLIHAGYKGLSSPYSTVAIPSGSPIRTEWWRKNFEFGFGSLYRRSCPR